MTTLTRRRPAARNRAILGQFGRWVTDESTGTRRAVLTEEGRALAEAWCRRYPRPIRLLARAYTRTLLRARRLGANDDEINSACLAGLVDGIARYRPEVATLATWLPWHMRSVVVRQVIRPRRRQLDRAVGEAVGDWDAHRLSRLTNALARPDFGTHLGEWETTRRRVYSVLCRVADARDRELFAARFGLLCGVSCPAETVAVAFALSVTEVEELCAAVLDRIRPDLETLSDC